MKGKNFWYEIDSYIHSLDFVLLAKAGRVHPLWPGFLCPVDWGYFKGIDDTLINVFRGNLGEGRVAAQLAIIGVNGFSSIWLFDCTDQDMWSITEGLGKEGVVCFTVKRAAEDDHLGLPVLETDRLILRKLLPSDAWDMYEYASDTKVTKYLTWFEHASINETSDYINGIGLEYDKEDWYDWAVEEKSSGKMIGTCGFSRIDKSNCKAEVGYAFNRKYWGQGIATEVLREVINYGFTRLSLHRVEAMYVIGNEASGRVMKKCGMTYEGTLREAYLARGELKTVKLYAILRQDWRKNRHI